MLGNDKFAKKEYASARDFYTEGIKVNCKDKELKAKLYNNRATQHFYLGEKFLRTFVSLLQYTLGGVHCYLVM